jgi:hypothetical protein
MNITELRSMVLSVRCRGLIPGGSVGGTEEDGTCTCTPHTKAEPYLMVRVVATNTTDGSRGVTGPMEPER